MKVGHAQLFRFGQIIDLAFVPNVWLGQLVLEKPFVVVARFFGRPFGQASEVIGIGDGFLAAALRDFRKQSEVKTFNRFAAFERKLGADAPFFFEAGDFMTSGATKVANPPLTLVFQLGIVHE